MLPARLLLWWTSVAALAGMQSGWPNAGTRCTSSTPFQFTSSKHSVDLMRRHDRWASVRRGEARSIELAESCAAAVLLLGPL